MENQMEHFEIIPPPIKIISDNDKQQTIRVVNLPKSIITQIWNNLSLKQKKIQKLKRYFEYQIDNPPLTLVLKLFPSSEKEINFIKGHGMSIKVKIPKTIDKDLAYILGAIRDGGIHFDKLNNAYKIHFSQKSKKYLETEIIPRLKRLFDITPSISKRKDNVYQIQFASKPIYLLFSKVFDMKEIQQYWDTPQLIKKIPKLLKKEYIKGFYDAEGSKDHLYHSWNKEGECPPLEFICNVLNKEFGIKTTKPLRIKTDDKFDRYPAYQLFINDYQSFKLEILGTR
jgi:intein-encoded DNA endonuclease-like protein